MGNWRIDGRNLGTRSRLYGNPSRREGEIERGNVEKSEEKKARERERALKMAEKRDGEENRFVERGMEKREKFNQEGDGDRKKRGRERSKDHSCDQRVWVPPLRVDLTPK